MITFAIEPIASVWDEMTKDWIDNWGQEYIDKGEPPDLKIERYLEFERAGWYLQFVARDEGKAIGYLGAYLTPSMHTQKLVAAEDILYIKPEYRKGFVSKRFIEYVERTLKDKGAISISVTVNPESPASRLLEHMDYRVVQHNYEKRLT